MHRTPKLVSILAAVTMVTAGCTAGSSLAGPEAAPSIAATGSGATGSHEPVTLTLWETAAGEDLDRVKEGLKHFTDRYPWITLNVVGNMTDSSRILSAVHAGTVPDVWQYYTPQMPLQYCKTGALMDLQPLIKRDKIDMKQFNPYWVDYMAYDGRQCSLPSFADAYGLYYNKKLLADAGYTSPPKTMTELAAMAKKLTQFNADGSIKVAGFVPTQSFYDQWMPNFTVPFGAKWFADGKPALTSDPAWADLFNWQKDLTDWYGYDKLQRFIAGVNNLNYTPEHAGETGKVAMWLDGEWRLGMIAADKAAIDYGVAPPPVPDNRTDAYGSGFVASNTVSIPKGTKHLEEAWLLTKFLSTDDDWFNTEVQVERVIPATEKSLDWARKWAADKDPNFTPFLDIYAARGSAYMDKELGTCGCDILDTVQSTSDEWLSGKFKTAEQALQSAQKTVEDQMSLKSDG